MEKLWASREHHKDSSRRRRNVVITIILVSVSIFFIHLFVLEPQASRYINVTFEDSISSLLLLEGLFLALILIPFAIIELISHFEYKGPNIILYREGLEFKGKFTPWPEIRQIRIVSQVGEELLRASLIQSGDAAIALSGRGETMVGVKGAGPMTRETSINDLPRFIRTIKELGMENRVITTNQFKTMVGLGRKSEYEKELARSN